MTIETVYLLLPEIILVLLATALFVGGTFTTAREGWSWLAAGGLLLAGIALGQQQGAIRQYQSEFRQQQATAANQADSSDNDAAGGLPAVHAVRSGPLMIDLFSQTTRWFVLAVGLVLVMLLGRSASSELTPEFMGSLLLIMTGLMVIAMANDLVLMFLGLELVSIPTYVVLYLGRIDARSQEAATKYFFLSILSSALLLYGFSFLYGVAGNTQLRDIHHVLAAAPRHAEGLVTLARLAMVLIFAGLGFRITAVPFHFYAPDVYQGTSHGNAALLSVVPKIAGLAALVRIVVVPMGFEGAIVGEGSYLVALAKIGWQLSLVLAVLTMTLGNLLALWQQNVRRMLAYSSIAHAGYMLIGLAVAFAVAGGARSGSQVNGVGATLFYLLVYALATTGAFAALAYLSGEERQLDTIDELAGVGRSHPTAAGALAVCMFSLTGLPPLAGFWGKFVLISGALSAGDPAITGEAAGPSPLWQWFIGLSVVAMINAAISAGYYLRVVAALYFREPLSAPAAQGGSGAALAAVLCSLGVVVAGIYPTPWMAAAQRASEAAQVSIVHSTELVPATAANRQPAEPGASAPGGALAGAPAER